MNLRVIWKFDKRPVSMKKSLEKYRYSHVSGMYLFRSEFRLPAIHQATTITMAEPPITSDPTPIGSAATSTELEPSLLYAVLTYRGDLATWNWAFFVPDPSVSPIGSAGTLFHVVNGSDSAGEWKFEVETKDVVSSPLVVAIVRLADVGFLGGYEDVVGQDSLLPMFKTVAIPAKGSAIHPAEFSSRTWFLDAICVLHDCGVLTCDDVWLLEREIRRSAFTAMDKYLENKGMHLVFGLSWYD